MASHLSRRDALKFGAASLLSTGFWPGAIRAADQDSGSFRFLCLNDLHCMDDESGRWLEKEVVARIKSLPKPVDFCLVIGDLVEDGTAKELGIVRDVLKSIGLPLHVVPGNHDYAKGDKLDDYRQMYPDSLNYQFEHKGWQFVGLDSTDGVRYSDISVQKTTIDWITQAAPKLDRKKPTVLFTHFPFGTGAKYRPKNADDVLKPLLDHNLQAVFSGHYHARTERTQKQTILTTNACCALKRKNHDGSAEKGFVVCTAADGKLTREFVVVARDAAAKTAK